MAFKARDLTTTVIADPADLEAGETLMLEIAAQLEDTMPPMLAARHIAIEDMQNRFDTETDPEGTPWVDLDPDYDRWKQSVGGIDKILQFDGYLVAAATSPNAWLISDNTLLFNPEVLPLTEDGKNYGLMHQAGSGDPLHWGMRDRLAHEDSDSGVGAHSSVGVGAGNALPARPFIGISADAEDKMFFIFEEWFQNVGSLYIRPSGVAQSRTAGGRFGPKVA